MNYPRPLLAFAALLVACSSSNAPRPKTAPSDANTVTSSDIEKHPDQPIEKILQGRYPGLLVTRSPDGGIAVNIRGSTAYSSLSSGTQPLYMLDGLQFSPGRNGALTGIDPNEIESIKLVKGADAAMYGIQGANGVILITTKRAKP